MDEEIIAKNIVKNRDPKCLYFLDADGNLIKRPKAGILRKKGSRKRKKIFNDLNLTIPTILLKAYISNEKRVIKYGNSGAMISMPKSLIGFKGRVVLIPSEALNDVSDGTLNLF